MGRPGGAPRPVLGDGGRDHAPRSSTAIGGRVSTRTRRSTRWTSTRPGTSPWWPRPDVMLFNVLVHVLTETSRHAGHADILSEQLGDAPDRVPAGRAARTGPCVLGAPPRGGRARRAGRRSPRRLTRRRSAASSSVVRARDRVRRGRRRPDPNGRRTARSRRAAQPTAARSSSCNVDELVGDLLHAARPGLEDRRGVERDPLEAEAGELLGAGDDAVVLVEGLAAGVVGRRGEHRLQPDRRRVAPGLRACRRMVAIAAAHVVVGAGDHAHPPVAELAGAPQGHRPEPTDPDRQALALRRLGLHGDLLGEEPGPALLDALVAPARPQVGDGLVHPPAAGPVVLAERLVLRGLPADAHAEAHPPAGQRVERAHLLGHQCRLALREHEHLGGQGDPEVTAAT